MLKECRQALRITTEAYDGELCSLMSAGAQDLTIAGVTLPGKVTFAYVEATQSTAGYWNDTSTLTDPLVIRAILTYVRMNFGSPNDYDQLRTSYGVQKTQLMHATGYTDYGEETEEADEQDGDGE